MKRARHKQGSVVFDKRRKIWNYLWCENGSRKTKRIGTVQEYPTKSAAWQKAETFRQHQKSQTGDEGGTLEALSKNYELEKLPSRSETARVYRSWLHNHILPKWGKTVIKDIQPRPVELWLRGLDLSPKTKSHLKNLMRVLVDYAMWSGVIEVTRNPMALVHVKGVTKRVRKPRNLTVNQFHSLMQHLKQPFNLMAYVSVCLGLRVSEALALKWVDVRWSEGKINVERGIIRQIVDDVKTDESRKLMPADKKLLSALREWRGQSQFSSDADWIFTSPLKLGRLPYSYTGFWRELQRAAKLAGIGHVGTHTFRHTCRSWLDAGGNANSSSTKVDASCRHSHDYEHLWGCRD